MLQSVHTLAKQTKKKNNWKTANTRKFFTYSLFKKGQFTQTNENHHFLTLPLVVSSHSEIFSFMFSKFQDILLQDLCLHSKKMKVHIILFVVYLFCILKSSAANSFQKQYPPLLQTIYRMHCDQFSMGQFLQWKVVSVKNANISLSQPFNTEWLNAVQLQKMVQLRLGCVDCRC